MMRDQPWDRVKAADSIRDNIWRIVSPASTLTSDVLPLAAGVLGLSRRDQRFLASLHLLIAPQTDALLAAAPGLVRHLTTSTTTPLHEHPEQVRGPIDWPATLARRTTHGRRTTYATRPVERDYSTPENRLLMASLARVRGAFDDLEWSGTRRGLGLDLEHKADIATRLLGSPIVHNVIDPPKGSDLLRVERGRASRRFTAVSTFWRLAERLHDLDDPALLRQLVERTALLAATDGALFESVALFKVLDTLTQMGWNRRSIGLVKGRVVITQDREDRTLDVIAQGVPADFPSRYGDALTAHQILRSALRPDIVLDLRPSGTGLGRRTAVVEVKLRPRAADGARAALFDSLAYREAFRDAQTKHLCSIGTFWGRGQAPVKGLAVKLCSIDNLHLAVKMFLDTAEGNPGLS